MRQRFPFFFILSVVRCPLSVVELSFDLGFGIWDFGLKVLLKI